MMQAKREKIWYGFTGIPYRGTEPPFFDTRNFEWAAYIESHFETIRDELQVLFDNADQDLLRPYFEDKIQYPPKNWKTESFCYWGRKNFKLCRIFPKTYAILNEIPGLVSASINLLEPQSAILPHFGDTNGIYRCHMGLQVPAGLPLCGFKVEGETRRWEDGKLLIFLDAYTHEAYNMSDQKRYILLFDVIRPEFRSRQYRICITVLSMLTLYWFLSKNSAVMKFAAGWPITIKKASLLPFQLAWAFYLPLSNFIRGIYLGHRVGSRS